MSSVKSTFTSKPETKAIEQPLRPLTMNDIFITDDSPSLPYEDWDKYEAVHYGQLKVLITDVAFLTLFFDSSKTPRPVMIVVGAAPGEHYPILATMFPMIQFHLYDPKPFTIKELKNITLHHQKFTDEDANKWSEQGNNIYFASDIRSARSGKMSREEFTANVTADMNMQASWVKKINPVAASLKFRLPYVDPDSNGKLNDIIYPYLDGYVMKQPFAKLNTNECRLICVKTAGQYFEKKWSSIKLQDQAYYHNRYVRTFKFENPFTKDTTHILNDDLTVDFDSVATMFIIRNYIYKMTGSMGGQEDSIALFKVMMDDINSYRQTPLFVSQIRKSTWKSSSYNISNPQWAPPAALDLPAKPIEIKPLMEVVPIGTPSSGGDSIAPATSELL